MLVLSYRVRFALFMIEVSACKSLKNKFIGTNCSIDDGHDNDDDADDYAKLSRKYKM